MGQSVLIMLKLFVAWVTLFGVVHRFSIHPLLSFFVRVPLVLVHLQCLVIYSLYASNTGYRVRMFGVAGSAYLCYMEDVLCSSGLHSPTTFLLYLVF